MYITYSEVKIHYLNILPSFVNLLCLHMLHVICLTYLYILYIYYVYIYIYIYVYIYIYIICILGIQKMQNQNQMNLETTFIWAF